MNVKNQEGGSTQMLLPVPTILLAKVFEDIKTMQKDNLNDIPIESRDERGEQEVKGLKFIAKKIKILLEKNKKIQYNEASRILINNFASEEKAERNIKRRVYDAINVLVSAGVILKDDNKIQLMHEKNCNQRIISYFTQKSQKPQFQQQIDSLKKQINRKKLYAEQLKIKLTLLKNIYQQKNKKSKRDCEGQQIIILEWSPKITDVKIKQKGKLIEIKGGKCISKSSDLLQYLRKENIKLKT